ncbi:unknown similar to AMEV070 [Mythimna separata entomopoxvirus 'L']|uniref:Peptidase M10 metallopeptidase domain-containing protein n=1 Tax=Mythimna separata entomopoxvirus 'L' TaxID=1293572 RepID=A0A916NYF0_9POXV|nr:unknown similar to AMEV070 [Mythimna separata entomopoxvirus 'L']CCU56289.1 unknown similar to AMEV070 [Mythimna separata entomopoxvirus 'L']
MNLFKYCLLIFISIIYLYNNIINNVYKRNNNCFLKQIIYIKDIIYFNNNIRNMSSISEWSNFLYKNNIFCSVDTINNIINNIYNNNTILLIKKLYKCINKIKYIKTESNCNKNELIYWNYVSNNDFEYNYIFNIFNKCFEAWNKYRKYTCKTLIFKNNTNYEVTEISIQNNSFIIYDKYIRNYRNENFEKLVLGHFHTKYIHLKYDYIKYNINDEKNLIILIMHEIGHLIGLDHNNNMYSVMNKYHNNNLYKYLNVSDPANILHYFDVYKMN